MKLLKLLSFILFVGIWILSCSPQDIRQAEMRDDQQNNWGGPFEIKSSPPLTFSDRVYLGSNGEPYNGAFKIYYPNEKIKWEGTLSRGRLHGEVIGYYFDGSLWQVRHYKLGVLLGPFKELYEDGALKLEGELVGPSGYGGDKLRDFSFGTRDFNGHHIGKRKMGRIQMIRSSGRTPYENEMIELSEQVGYMLFSTSFWRINETITSDSRGNYTPFQGWD